MPKAPEKKIKDIDLAVAKAVEPKGGAARRAKVVSKPKSKVEPEKLKETPKRTKKVITSTKRKKAAATETPKRKKKVITSAKRKKAAMKEVPNTTKRGIAADKKREALPVGKRTSAAGNTYYEYRRNRADRNAKRKFAKGGEVDNYVVTNGEMFLSNRGGKFILTDNVEMAYTYSKKEAEQQVKHAESLSKDNSKFKVESFSMYNKYAKGGQIRSKSALAKDRKYTSDEPHELRYRFVRKSKVKRYDTKMAKGGEVDNIKVGVKVGLLNPRNGRYKYSTIEKIEGENVFLVEKHPTRSQWDNHWKTTKSQIERFLNENNADFKSKKSYVLKMASGGEVGEYLIYNSSDKKLVQDYLKSKKYKKQYREDFDNIFNLKIIEVPYEKFTDYRLIATKKTAK